MWARGISMGISVGFCNNSLEDAILWLYLLLSIKNENNI